METAAGDKSRPILASKDAAGRLRGGKTGRLKRTREEMYSLYKAVVQASLRGLTPHEASALLEAQGHGAITPQRYSDLLQAARHNAPRRLAEAGRIAQRYHIEALDEMESIRDELWRQFYAVKDPPRGPDEPDWAETTALQRGQWAAAAAIARSKILKELRELEPFVSAYAEAAELRTQGVPAYTSDAAAAMAGEPVSAREWDDRRRHRATNRPALEVREPADDAFQAVPDPDHPNQTIVVPVGPRPGASEATEVREVPA